jgi:hypothetical protein
LRGVSKDGPQVFASILRGSPKTASTSGRRQRGDDGDGASMRRKDRALPQIGRDVVKIGGMDGGAYFRRAGDIRARSMRNKEKPMNAMTSEKLPSEKIETTVEDPNLAAVSEVEAGIRDFVRNDVAYLRRSPSMLAAAEPALDASAEATVNNVNSLIQRVAGTSLTEIENLVSELETLRDLLHSEGQRVQREISGYAQLSQAAMKSTRMIADNVAQWKRVADGLRNG